MANFSAVYKDNDGNKVYHNCSAYGEKSDISKDFKQGDFVKQCEDIFLKALKGKRTDERARRKERICTWSYQEISG